MAQAKEPTVKDAAEVKGLEAIPGEGGKKAAKVGKARMKASGIAKVTKARDTSKGKKTPMAAPNKLMLLFTVVSKEKTELYQNLLEEFEINMQMILSAHGTLPASKLALLGLNDSEKSVIISVVKREHIKSITEMLEEKFRTVKGGKGIAYTVPMTSVIGVAIYQFLSNTSGGGFI